MGRDRCLETSATVRQLWLAPVAVVVAVTDSAKVTDSGWRHTSVENTHTGGQHTLKLGAHVVVNVGGSTIDPHAWVYSVHINGRSGGGKIERNSMVKLGQCDSTDIGEDKTNAKMGG